MKTFAIPSDQDLVVQLAEHEVDFAAIEDKVRILSEAVVMPDEGQDVFAQMREIAKMMDAAKKGLGITNKLSDPVQKKQHRSTVMSNMNKISGRLRSLAKKIDAHWESWRRNS